MFRKNLVYIWRHTASIPRNVTNFSQWEFIQKFSGIFLICVLSSANNERFLTYFSSFLIFLYCYFQYHMGVCICVCACVYMGVYVYVSVHVCVCSVTLCICVWVHICIRMRRPEVDIDRLLQSLSTLCFKTKFSPNLELTCLSRRGGQQALGIVFSSSFLHLLGTRIACDYPCA